MQELSTKDLMHGMLILIPYPRGRYGHLLLRDELPCKVCSHPRLWPTFGPDMTRSEVVKLTTLAQHSRALLTST